MGERGSRPLFDPRQSIELHRDWLLGRENKRDLIPERGPPLVPSPSPKIVVPAQDDTSAPWELARVAHGHQDPLVRAAATSLCRMLAANLEHDTSVTGKHLCAVRDRVFQFREQLAEAARLAQELRSFLDKTVVSADIEAPRLVSADIEALRRVTLPLILAGDTPDIGRTPQPDDFIWQMGWDGLEGAATFLAWIGKIPIEAMGLPARKHSQKVLLRAVLQDLCSGGWVVENVSRQLIDDSHNDPKGQLGRLRLLRPAHK